MSESAADLAFACDLFAGLGPVRARRMFGAAGLYVGEAMFGLIDGGRIFLKTDEMLRGDLAQEGSIAWIYSQRKGPKAGMAQETSYWSLPESAMDDPDEACAWGRRALAVAEHKWSASPKRRRRPRA